MQSKKENIKGKVNKKLIPKIYWDFVLPINEKEEI